MNVKMRSRISGVVGTLAIVLGSASCGDVAQIGRSPSILVIDALQAAEGDTPSSFGPFLLSDVLTKGTIYNDPGQVALRTVLKDLGVPGASTTPTVMNAVTLSRYHVVFLRTDGRNTQGVDVPYAFDGAVTGTITPSGLSVGFELVRHQAKLEPPLSILAGQGGRVIISTIAEVTFYGKDVAGNDVQAIGKMSVNFGDFADPE